MPRSLPGPVIGLPCDRHVASSRRLEASDDAQQRRLAATGGADQADELARRDSDVDARKRLDLVVTDRKALGHAANGEMGALDVRHDAAGSSSARDSKS